MKLLPKNSSFNFCFNNTTTWNMKSIKSKHEIVAKKFKLQFLLQQHNYLKHEINQIKAWNCCQRIQASIFVSTTQLLETWNQSNQSMKWLPKNSSFNFCFNNTTTRIMKSFKSKLEIVAKKFKLQFLFQQHNYLKHEINQIKAWNCCQKNSSFNFCFNNTTTRNMKSIKSKLKMVAQKIQASIFVSTTQLLETWNQSSQSLKLLPKIQASNTTRNMKSIKWTPMPIEK
jgi:hypothetical protein